jgi:hypothetical protein
MRNSVAAALALAALFGPTTAASGQAEQSNKITIVCMFKRGIMTPSGDLSPSPTDKQTRLFAINFVPPTGKPEFVALDTIQIHDPNGLLEGQTPVELMYFKDGRQTFGLFAGQKTGVMHTVLGSRPTSPGASFAGALFRSGISPTDTQQNAYAGRCMERGGVTATADFEAFKKMPPVSE